ncbi:hypothetical protein P4C99_04120 [Pontiellaceae bacterium B1224]|nr:hypothetical protein [Pontiellaceae bacterium B1224]
MSHLILMALLQTCFLSVRANEQTVKIPVEQLSEEDQVYIELARPPKFNITFTKKNRQKTFVMEHISTSSDIRVPETRTHYGVKLRQTSAGDYHHELGVEFFAIGQERLGQEIHSAGSSEDPLHSRYVVIVTDERDEIIAMEASTDRLIKNLEKLKPGNYMDKQCNRVYPTQPPRTRY